MISEPLRVLLVFSQLRQQHRDDSLRHIGSVFVFFAKDERNQQLRVHHEHYLSQSDVHRIIEILE